MKRNDGWVFIVNPVAGGGYAGSCVGTLRQAMQRHGVDGEIVLTKARGHATELAAGHAARGVPRIVGVGGDGTFGEIAQGLAGRPGVLFGAVAAGTGNDFVHALGFPGRFAEPQWAALFAATAAGMDVGRCNGRCFVNGMGLGFDAQVALENYRSTDGGVKPGSRSKYTWHIVKNLFGYRERPMRVTLDGRTVEQRSFLNTIANGRRLAGGIPITPRALVDDGLLDVCMTDPLNLLERFRELGSFTKGAHLGDPVVHYRQVDRACFEFDGEAPAHLDGEVISGRRFDIEVLPRGLRAIYDPAGAHCFGLRAP
jgi:diacylglycerol kinase (ATP)